MDQAASLENRLSTFRDYLINGKVKLAKSALPSIPELKNNTDGQFAVVIRDAVRLNNLEIISWLNENCPDCAINRNGSPIIHDMGSNYEGKLWRSMNFDTFKFVYDQGGVAHFLEENPDVSIVSKISDYFIPESDGVYSDYKVRKADRDNESTRRSDKLKMLSYLLEKGHDVNGGSFDEMVTAFANAAKAQDQELMNFLLENGADPNVGSSPLATVVSHTPPEQLRHLLELGLDPNAVTNQVYSSPSSTTVLGRLVESGQFKPELLLLLEEYGVDVNVVDSHGKAPIDYAFGEFDKERKPYTDFLLEHGAVKTDQYYYSTLIHAVQRSNQKLLDTVLSTNPQLANGLSEDEKTLPLERAVWANNSDAFEALVGSGAKLDEAYAALLLSGALFRKNYDLASLIIKVVPTTPANRTFEKDDGSHVTCSPMLYEAASDNNLNWVKLLLARGAVLDADQMSNFPIYGAALNGHIDVVQTLLDAGSIANPADEMKKETLMSVLENISAKSPKNRDRNNIVIELLKSYLETHKALK